MPIACVSRVSALVVESTMALSHASVKVSFVKITIFKEDLGLISWMIWMQQGDLWIVLE
jgi:hypothetical protein